MWKTDVKDLLDSTDVQDPTDFPPSSTTPGLRALDSALRCNICQELYEAPVVLTCGHCFCSLVRVTVTISRLHLITGAPLLAVCTQPNKCEAGMSFVLERNRHQQF
jgi:RING-type zinc-finger